MPSLRLHHGTVPPLRGRAGRGLNTAYGDLRCEGIAITLSRGLVAGMCLWLGRWRCCHAAASEPQRHMFARLTLLCYILK